MAFDERLLVATLEHYRQASSGRVGRAAVKLICAAGLTILAALIIFTAMEKPGVAWLALIPLLFLALLAVGPKFDFWLAKRRFRSSPFYRDELFVSVEERGIFIVTPKVKTELAWSAVVRATRFAQGFLVILGPGTAYWWPNTAMVAGNVGHVDRLLRAHARRYRTHVA